MIAWALMEDPVVIGRTYPNDRTSLEKGFAILTGRKPLHLEGGEPVMVDRSAFDHAAAQQIADIGKAFDQVGRSSGPVMGA